MAISFIVGETQRENLPDGDYTAVVKHIEEKMDKYGTYIQIEEEITHPSEYSGRLETERFYIGAYDDTKKNRAKWQFSVLCKQLCGLKTGEALSEGNIVNKKFVLTIKNNSSDNGKVYQNTVRRVVLPNQEASEVKSDTVMYGNIGIQSDQPVYTKPLNDEVPF